tara:strand:+ start:71 stop:1561 length:1491 start_codon:yes stop_codon:yes gene_type:complete
MKMIKSLLIILPIFLYSDPNILWFQDHGGTGEESHGHYIHSCDDGGFIQVGETYDYSNNSSKVFIVKTNENGTLDWSREIGAGDHNLGNSVLELEDGFLIAGGLNQNSSLIKLDKESGSTIFIKTNDNGGVDAYEQAAKIPGGIVAVGYVHSEDPWNTFFTWGEGNLVFFDDNGNVQSSQSLNEYMAQGYRVRYIHNSILISGLSEDASDFILVKMDLEGNVIWEQAYGGNSDDHCFGMDVNDNGEIFLAGHTLSGTANWDTYTIKIDFDGEILWERIIGNPRGFDPEYIHDEAWGIRATDDGGCVTIAGTGDEYEEYSECYGEECSDIWRAYLIKFDEGGQVEWERTFSPLEISEDNYDWAGEDIDLTDDGGAIVAVDNGQFGFLRIENVQNALDIDNEKLVTEDFKLFSNFPNPFNSSTKINYQLLEKNYVRLNIFDTNGNALIELVNEFQRAGVYSMLWRGTNNQGLALPSGIYYYQIQVGDRLKSNKMVLIK